jgi:rRNA maturation RNase YbeY
MPVAVDNRQRRIRLSTAAVARAARRALAAVGRPAGTVDLALVNDAEIRRMNSAFRGVRRRTDVLAFPVETPDSPGQLVGQVVVSVDTARRQARRVGVTLSEELALLVTHGTLHLVGYDDRDPVEANLMHRRERAILESAHRRLSRRLWTGLLPPGRPAGRRARRRR